MKAVIFDLDGVICSTDEYHYLAWKALADREGIYFDKVINNYLRGISRKDSLELILMNSKKKYSNEEKEEMLNYKNEVYKKLLAKLTPDNLSNDVMDTLKTLKKRGFKIAIGSSSKNAKTILKQLNIIEMFDAIIDGTNISKSKPDPEVFLKAAEMLNLQVTDCYVVDDAFSGIDAAKVGNFVSIGIGDASSYDKVDYKINILSDLLKILNLLG